MAEDVFDVFSMNSRVRELELWGKQMNGSVGRLADDLAALKKTIDEVVVPSVDNLVKKDEMSAAVTKALDDKAAWKWTVWHRVALVFGIATGMIAGTGGVIAIVEMLLR